MYDLGKMEQEYNTFEPGNAKIQAIREAIAEADRQDNIPYRMYFRAELNRESVFRWDSMDLLVSFPELLALEDRYPGTLLPDGTQSTETIIWHYKWLLHTTVHFYQVSREDSLRFFEDYRRRILAMGYNERTYYFYLSEFFWPIDKEYAWECFRKKERFPRDLNSDCEACERNQDILLYLWCNQPEKAAQLGQVIDSYRLTCFSDQKRARMELRASWLGYYLERGEFDKAAPYCLQLERKKEQEDRSRRWAACLCCNAHLNIGKALDHYKNRWREWEQWRCPEDSFYMFMYISNFFGELKAQSGKSTVKIPYDDSFPLYRQDQEYQIEDLYQHYYGKARELVQRFDERNGTGYFREKLDCMTACYGNQRT